jgi:DUF1365 family protein
MGTVMLIIADCPTRYTGKLRELGNKVRIVCDIDAIEDCKLIQTAASGRRRTATDRLLLYFFAKITCCAKGLNIHSGHSGAYPE